LLEVIVLNLSRNNLAGVMPEKTGQLKQLPSLDFSENRLSGRIPTSGDLNFLSHLNLSYNNLPGRIPSSTQLQSFDASAFNGNPALCGAPITQKCPDTSKSTS
jgi:Leucine-rich repeat (LRR) protein